MFIKLWMQQDVTTVDENTPIGQAVEIISQSHFRHLPVVKDNTLVGIITQSDIHRALPSAIDSSSSPQKTIIATQAKVSSFMTSNPVTAHPMDPLEDVALLMRRFKIGAVPVVENDELLGIITETDIFQAFAEILGGGESGARIELQIQNNGAAVYKITDICKDFNMQLLAITIIKNYSPDHQLLTIRVAGKEMDSMIDALWDSGAKVNRVLLETEQT